MSRSNGNGTFEHRARRARTAAKRRRLDRAIRRADRRESKFDDSSIEKEYQALGLLDN